MVDISGEVIAYQQ